MVDSVGIKYSNYYRPHFKGEVENANNFKGNSETDKDGTQKYLTSKNIMLGLSAIGHKNGWFSKGAKNASEIAGSSKNPKAQTPGIEPENLHVSGKVPSAKYDPETGKLIQETYYQDDGKTVLCIKDYDPTTGNGIKQTWYQDDGKTVLSIDDYDPTTGNRIKQTWYQDDGKTVLYVDDYDPTTGNRIKHTLYQADGKTIKSIREFDPQTGEEIK